MAQSQVDILLRVESQLNGLSNFIREQEKAEKQSRRFAASVQTHLGQVGKLAAGYLSARVALGKMNQSIQEASRIDDAARTFGVAARELQAMEFAARELGIRSGAVEMGIQRWTRRIGEARIGKGELLGVLQRYNLALTDSEGRNRTNTEILRDFADVLAAAEDPAAKLAIAQKAFDSEGARMSEIFKEGAASIEEWAKRAEDAGQLMGDDMVSALALAENRMERFGQKMKVGFGWAAYGLDSLINLVTFGVKAAVDGLDEAQAWVVSLDQATTTAGSATAGLAQDFESARHAAEQYRDVLEDLNRLLLEGQHLGESQGARADRLMRESAALEAQANEQFGGAVGVEGVELYAQAAAKRNEAEKIFIALRKDLAKVAGEEAEFQAESLELAQQILAVEQELASLKSGVALYMPGESPGDGTDLEKEVQRRERILELERQLASLKGQQNDERERIEAEFERERELAEVRLQMVLESLQTEEEAIQASYERRRDIILTSTFETEEERQEYLTRLDEERSQMMHDVEMTRWSTALGSFSDFQTNMQVLAQTGNKKLVAIYKAAAIATTMMQTYQGAQSAYTSLASIPYVGPFLGAAAAAAAIAAGLARIQAIRSQSYGGAFLRGGVVGNGSVSSTDNRVIEAADGERVIPNGPSQAYAPLLDAMIRGEDLSRYAVRGMRPPAAGTAGDQRVAHVVGAPQRDRESSRETAVVDYRSDEYHRKTETIGVRLRRMERGYRGHR